MSSPVGNRLREVVTPMIVFAFPTIKSVGEGLGAETVCCEPAQDQENKRQLIVRSLLRMVLLKQNSGDHPRISLVSVADYRRPSISLTERFETWRFGSLFHFS